MTVQTEQLLAQVAEELRAPLLAAQPLHRATRGPRRHLRPERARAAPANPPRPDIHDARAPRQRAPAALPKPPIRSPPRARRTQPSDPRTRASRQARRRHQLIAARHDTEREVLGRERLRTLIAALRELPAAQRDAVLAERTFGDTERKRRWRGRRTLLASLDGL